MKFFYKIAIYSIACVFCTTNLSLAATLADQEIRGLQALEDIQFTITSLAERVTPMVVNITPIREITSSQGFKRRGSYTQGSGSGVIIREDGVIVTNNHVVGEDTSEAEVRLSDKSHAIARVIGRDKETDIAVQNRNRSKATCGAVRRFTVFKSRSVGTGSG